MQNSARPLGTKDIAEGPFFQGPCVLGVLWHPEQGAWDWQESGLFLKEPLPFASPGSVLATDAPL